MAISIQGDSDGRLFHSPADFCGAANDGATRVCASVLGCRFRYCDITTVYDRVFTEAAHRQFQLNRQPQSIAIVGERVPSASVYPGLNVRVAGWSKRDSISSRLRRQLQHFLIAHFPPSSIDW
jgi:hypothetical protein